MTETMGFMHGTVPFRSLMAVLSIRNNLKKIIEPFIASRRWFIRKILLLPVEIRPVKVKT
jgi:hypothetical protein